MSRSLAGQYLEVACGQCEILVTSCGPSYIKAVTLRSVARASILTINSDQCSRLA